MQECKVCLMDATVPSLVLNKKGQCQYCEIYYKLSDEYPLNNLTGQKLNNIVKKIKITGRGKKYDCVCGISGGRDSSYTLYYIKEVLGLRPLAVHYDNGFNSQISTNNIYNICSKLDIDLETEVEDWDNFREILRAFFYASVPDVDIPTDLGIFKTMYKFADKLNIKYVVNGHNFRNEGMDPLDWTYMDPLYLKNICEINNKKVNIKNFNNFYLRDLIKYKLIRRIKTFLPLNYIKLNYVEIEEKLTKDYGWKFYDEHHYESTFTKFLVGYYLPEKFKIDRRKTDLSAMIRSKQISREEAKRLIKIPPNFINKEKTIEFVLEKLDFDNKEWKFIMNKKNFNYNSYKNYHKILKKFKFFIYILVKLNLIPNILYLKFLGK
tara:strand:- start:229 stop:1365 length:1137 start_codon:yes stop_codon:yes gene_type:complete